MANVRKNAMNGLPALKAKFNARKATVLLMRTSVLCKRMGVLLTSQSFVNMKAFVWKVNQSVWRLKRLMRS